MNYTHYIRTKNKTIYSGLCIYCKKLFFSHMNNSFFCSKKCFYLNNEFKIKTECLKCKDTYFETKYRYNRAKRHFCSDYCYKSYNVGCNSHLWKNGTITRKGYRMLCINQKLIFEHKYIMENHIGHKIPHNMDVHHINGIKTDNRIENLKIMSHSDHSKFHIKKFNPRTCSLSFV